MRILLISLLLCFGFSASAGMYKWVDEEGNIHYSQKPPRGKEYKKLKPPKPASQSNANIPAPAKKDTTKKPATSKKAEALAQKNQKIRAENCEKAKKNLANYQIHRRIRDKDGNITYVTDEDRARYIDNAKKAISNFCN